MGKIICLTLALLMVIGLAGCGGNDTEDNYVSTESNGETYEPEEDSSISTESVVEESEPEEVSSVATESKETNNDSDEWKEFLKDYEEWVDDYIVIVKKYQENPADMSVLTDYSEMVSDLAEWTDKADGIEESIKNTEDALEYSKELLRIAGKLAEVG